MHHIPLQQIHSSINSLTIQQFNKPKELLRTLKEIADKHALRIGIFGEPETFWIDRDLRREIDDEVTKVKRELGGKEATLIEEYIRSLKTIQ